MSSVVRSLLVLFLVAVCLSPALAQEKKKGKANPLDQAFQLPPDITLTEEQQKKVGELRDKYKDQVQDAARKARTSKEQTQAGKEAADKAKSDGKKGKEIQSARDEALKLTDEQKTARAELEKLRREVRKEFESLLTDEQRAKLPKPKDRKKKAA